MKYRNAQILNLVQIRTRRKLLEIRNALAPDASDDASAEALARSVGDQIKTLEPDERRRLWLKTAVAVQELDELREELSEHKTAVAEELKKLRSHQAAAGAYRQSQTGPKAGRR
jgi:hypothetical protein